MSQGLYRPRNLAIAGAIGIVVLGGAFPRTRKQALPETFETPAVKRIGDRFSAGGATSTHTPAVATKRGDASDQISSQVDMKGAGTPHFDEKFADQKASPETGVEKMLNKTYHGSGGLRILEVTGQSKGG